MTTAALLGYIAKERTTRGWKKPAMSMTVRSQITTPSSYGRGALCPAGSIRYSKAVYDLIVRRFLSIFYPPAVYQKMMLELEVGGEHFFSILRFWRRKVFTR